MRTKALFAAVLGVLGLSTAMAQVYSVNTVGYINVPLKGGFQMIANQLDNGQGNKLSALIPAPPEGTVVYKYTPSGYQIYTYDFGAWDPNGDVTMAPGEGVFVYAPGAAGTTVSTATFVGDVKQGALSVSLPAGFSIVSSIVPQQVALDNAQVAFPSADGDVVYKWSQSVGFIIYSKDFGTWDPAVPTIDVGESFFVYKVAAATWSRNFTVQ